MANNTRNVANNSIQSSMANLAKFNTISNSLAKENCEENDDNVGIISPPEFVTPRTTISKNKFANLNFGKGKNGWKNQRNNYLKPPKKSYTINSNRNSSSDSSFASIAQIGVKPVFHEQFTPSNIVRGSFEVKSNNDFLNNTAQPVLRWQDGYDTNPTNIYSTVDFRGSDMNELWIKGKINNNDNFSFE